MCPLYSKRSKPSQSIELKTKEICNSSRFIILLYSLFWFRNSGHLQIRTFFKGGEESNFSVVNKWLRKEHRNPPGLWRERVLIGNQALTPSVTLHSYDTVPFFFRHQGERTMMIEKDFSGHPDWLSCKLVCLFSYGTHRPQRSPLGVRSSLASSEEADPHPNQLEDVTRDSEFGERVLIENFYIKKQVAKL